MYITSNIKKGHHRPAGETPFEWRFAGGPMVVQHCMLAGYIFEAQHAIVVPHCIVNQGGGGSGRCLHIYPKNVCS